MAPVGEAFRLAIATNTVLELYQSDQSHPSMDGSYLAAAVFYETLFQKTVLTSTYNPGIATGTVSFLNQVAHQLVTDSAVITNIPKYFAKASFTSTSTSSASFQFISGTQAFTHQWHFGDGTSAQGFDPFHTYLQSGTYTVTLVIFNERGCPVDSTVKTVQVALATGIAEQGRSSVTLYPNPCTSYLVINAGAAFENNGSVLELITPLGQIIRSGVFTGTLNTESLPNGLYYIKISNAIAQTNSCFVK